MWRSSCPWCCVAPAACVSHSSIPTLLISLVRRPTFHLISNCIILVNATFSYKSFSCDQTHQQWKCSCVHGALRLRSPPWLDRMSQQKMKVLGPKVLKSFLIPFLEHFRLLNMWACNFEARGYCLHLTWGVKVAEYETWSEHLQLADSLQTYLLLG